MPQLPTATLWSRRLERGFSDRNGEMRIISSTSLGEAHALVQMTEVSRSYFVSCASAGCCMEM